eukprot:TRINITY_DN437_c0_g4_i1.p1 TRINITY_DN437_c0_g4~~TRINITY_DN437_c0_g4_i1.p1  ORF type:complete len:271 (-),score=18.89 TRINITY_DN437_c0_g4_i1:49-861(-)
MPTPMAIPHCLTSPPTDGVLARDGVTDRGVSTSDSLRAAPIVTWESGQSPTSLGRGFHLAQHACAVFNNRGRCWGRNHFGQLGQDDIQDRGDDAGEMATIPYIPLPGSFQVTAVSTGSTHTCAVGKNSGKSRLRCFGRNHQGQLGQNNLLDLGDDTGEIAAIADVPLGATTEVAQVYAGNERTCVILTSNDLLCWGSNEHGALGQDSAVTNIGGASNDIENLSPITFANGTVGSVAMGTHHICALFTGSGIRCWGSGGTKCTVPLILLLM